MIDPTNNTTPPSTLSQPLTLISNTKVPNVFPSVEVPYRLAIIGEAPGADEEMQGVPFVGASGRLLDSILSSSGILRSGCFVGNVCKYRPPNNDITEFDDYKDIKGKLRRAKGSWIEHPKVTEGIYELRSELASFKPHCTLLLGNTPLRFARGPGFPISEWRGSIMATSIGKAVPAYHPAFCLREYTMCALLRADVKRARKEAEEPTIILPQRNFDLDLSANEICTKLDNWPSGLLASVDIEGGLNAWSCISVASAPNYAFIIAFGQYTDSEASRVYVSLSRFLYREDIPKCLQNGLYDAFVLFYGFNMLIRNISEDTMLKSAEIYPELPKGLDTAASLWTREPQWKHLIAYSQKEQERRAKAGVDPAVELRNKHRACCIDSSVTLEISIAQDSALTGGNLRHYRFSCSLLSPFLYMEKRGFAYNKSLAQLELANCRTAMAECASRLEARVGYSVLGDKGSLSYHKTKKLLYEEKGYPPQYNGRGADKKLTSDIGALLKLSQKNPNDPLLSDLLLHSKLDGIRKTLAVDTDPDGRVRCAYNIVGAETMRVTCYESPTGSGMNLQTVTKKLRKLYVADNEKWLFQCDLSGADGWTVAAHCLRHGDPTMWDDYRSGLKPARIIALMYTDGVEATFCSRKELLEKCKSVDSDGWLYFACKRIQHATNYGVKEDTGVAQIMEDSYKMTGTPIYVTKEQFLTLQRFYLVRYPGIYQWHQATRNLVLDGKNITSASGHTRVFMGRRKAWDFRTRSVVADHDTWKEFLADEPQENTTYATNLALQRLWTDPENRSSSPRGHRLRIEPLHQVHDALNGQFSKTDTEWAIRRIQSYFQNTLRIADVDVIIPFEGSYGPNWSMHTTECPFQKTSNMNKCNCGAKTRIIPSFST